MSATLTGKIDDPTFGTWNLAVVNGGTTMELVCIDFSNDISASNTIPTRLSVLKGIVGHVKMEAGCATLQQRVITNCSLCEGPVLEISVGDISAKAVTDRRLYYVAWGW